MNGLDTTDNTTQSVQCLKESGIDFVIRYVSGNTNNFPEKRVTREETLALSSAGISVACVWENLPVDDNAKRAHFTFSQGVSDGKAAFAYLENVLEAPPNPAVYFAVDYDSTATDDNTILAAYFAGVCKAFHDMATEEWGYRIGAYASGATLDFLFAGKLIDLKWVTLSQGFRGSRGYANWDVRQIAEQTVCGLDADTNKARADFGQFTVSTNVMG